MRYGLVSFMYLFTLVGCGSSSTSTDSTGDKIEVGAPDDSAVDYSQIICEDDLIDVVTLINAYRATAQTCGGTSYPAVDGLTWNTSLAAAAEEHSDNMANYDFFDHTGIDDSTVATRVTAQGYSWSYVAENIAAGYYSAQAVVDGLMSSEGHCKNLMSENVTEIGLACSTNSDSSHSTYWTQVFAKPRS